MLETFDARLHQLYQIVVDLGQSGTMIMSTLGGFVVIIATATSADAAAIVATGYLC